MSDWLDNPVFIVSIGKSGTTLLVALLDGHKNVVVVPEETDFFDVIYTPAQVVLKNPLLSKEKKIQKIIDLYTERTHLRLLNGVRRLQSKAVGNIDYSDFKFESFKKGIFNYLSQKDLTIGTLISSIPYAFAECSNRIGLPTCWIEKTPYHIHNVREKNPCLEHNFARARFIHLYRHPLDTYIAFKNKDSAKWNIDKFAYDFKRSVEITRLYENRDNHFVLKYEDLVRFTEATLSQLTKFMGIEMQESLLQPTKNGKPWHGNSVYDVKYNAISSDSLDRHRFYENQEELKKLEARIADEMEYLDYEMNYCQSKSVVDVAYKKYCRAREREDQKAFFKYYSRTLISNLI